MQQSRVPACLSCLEARQNTTVSFSLSIRRKKPFQWALHGSHILNMTLLNSCGKNEQCLYDHIHVPFGFSFSMATPSRGKRTTKRFLVFSYICIYISPPRATSALRLRQLLLVICRQRSLLQQRPEKWLPQAYGVPQGELGWGGRREGRNDRRAIVLACAKHALHVRWYPSHSFAGYISSHLTPFRQPCKKLERPTCRLLRCGASSSKVGSIFSLFGTPFWTIFSPNMGWIRFWVQNFSRLFWKFGIFKSSIKTYLKVWDVQKFRHVFSSVGFQKVSRGKIRQK